MSKLVYIIWPGPGTSSKNYQADSLEAALSEKGASVRKINLIEHTPEELSQLQKPDGIYFNNISLPNVDSHMDILIEWNVPGINDATVQKLYTNKLVCYNALTFNNIKVPDFTVHAGPVVKEEISNLISTLDGFPLVVKPVFGYFGSDVYKVNSLDELCDKLEVIIASRGAAIIQKLITSKRGLALSVYRIGSDISCMLRVGSPFTDEVFKSDINTGRIRIPYAAPSELYDLSDNVMQALEVDVARLDVLLGEDGYYVIDVNLPGGFEGFDKIFNTKYANKLAQLLLEKIDAGTNAA